MDDEIAWKSEQRLWLEGISAYEELLDPCCLMVFPRMVCWTFPRSSKGSRARRAGRM